MMSYWNKITLYIDFSTENISLLSVQAYIKTTKRSRQFSTTWEKQPKGLLCITSKNQLIKFILTALYIPWKSLQPNICTVRLSNTAELTKPTNFWCGQEFTNKLLVIITQGVKKFWSHSICLKHYFNCILCICDLIGLCLITLCGSIMAHTHTR